MRAPPERSPERDAAIHAMLPNVAFDGWTRRALAAGLEALGEPADDADLLFPDGAVGMVEAFCDLADRDMIAAAAGLALGETSLPRRVRAVVALRLAQNRGHKEAVRRAVSVLALPGHARQAAACTARTVDSIWYAAGDRSADVSWYTKRAILAAIYTATLLFWLRDSSEDDAATLAFLDRGLAAHGRVHRLVSRAETTLRRMSPLRPRDA